MSRAGTRSPAPRRRRRPPHVPPARPRVPSPPSLPRLCRPRQPRPRRLSLPSVCGLVLEAPPGVTSLGAASTPCWQTPARAFPPSEGRSLACRAPCASLVSVPAGAQEPPERTGLAALCSPPLFLSEGSEALPAGVRPTSSERTHERTRRTRASPLGLSGASGGAGAGPGNWPPHATAQVFPFPDSGLGDELLECGFPKLGVSLDSRDNGPFS